jgi:hypothetical protein
VYKSMGIAFADTFAEQSANGVAGASVMLEMACAATRDIARGDDLMHSQVHPHAQGLG